MEIMANFAIDLRHNGSEGRPLRWQAVGVVSSREAACISAPTLPTGYDLSDIVISKLMYLILRISNPLELICN